MPPLSIEDQPGNRIHRNSAFLRAALPVIIGLILIWAIATSTYSSDELKRTIRLAASRQEMSVSTNENEDTNGDDEIYEPYFSIDLLNNVSEQMDNTADERSDSGLSGITTYLDVDQTKNRDSLVDKSMNNLLKSSLTSVASAVSKSPAITTSITSSASRSASRIP